MDQPRWVAFGHHPGTTVGNLKLIFNVSGGGSVSVSTGNEITWGREADFASIQRVELSIDGSLQSFDAGLTQDGEIIIQTFFDGRRLEVEFVGIELEQVQIVRIPEPG